MAGSRVRVTKNGDWMAAHRILSRLPRNMKKAAELTHVEAEAMARRIKNNIYTGSYAKSGWKPLKQSTKDRKAAAGHDSRSLIATGAYVKSISSKRTGLKTWFVGSTDPKQREVAAAHEYGTKRTPARPHYRVEIARMMSGEVKLKTLSAAMAKVIK